MISHPFITFDGSFAGFLNAIQRGLGGSYARISLNSAKSTNTLPLFGSGTKITTHTGRAKRLWEDLGLMGTEVQKRVYYSFLHADANLNSEIYQYVAALFCPEIEGIAPMGISAGKLLDTAVREVSWERREHEQRLIFKTLANGLYYSEIRPKHNVLPLLSRYCRSRYPSEPWMVVDSKRNESLSSLSGRLILASCMEPRGTESTPIKSFEADSGYANIENSSTRLSPDRSESPSIEFPREQKWDTAWRQHAV